MLASWPQWLTGKMSGRRCDLGGDGKLDLYFWGTVLNLIKSKSECMGWTRRPAGCLPADTCSGPRVMEHSCLKGDLGGHGNGVPSEHWMGPVAAPRTGHDCMAQGTAKCSFNTLDCPHPSYT